MRVLLDLCDQLDRLDALDTFGVSDVFGALVILDVSDVFDVRELTSLWFNDLIGTISHYVGAAETLFFEGCIALIIIALFAPYLWRVTNTK